MANLHCGGHTKDKEEQEEVTEYYGCETHGGKNTYKTFCVVT
jgi:hypothetical protein